MPLEGREVRGSWTQAEGADEKWQEGLLVAQEVVAVCSDYSWFINLRNEHVYRTRLES